ncbi:sensor histidine kinase [Pseudotenacibaculum sp. MALMAid0570]|uniref:tetratricopeptide repeat-containing sensor histidine kinase n=1 Tax=Pseudotenacibaculum sp. MALMAid0570 TaxID=3143938 RepID=UPI0032DF02FB
MKLKILCKIFLVSILFLFLLTNCNRKKINTNDSVKKNDSISIWIKASKDKNLSKDLKDSILQRAYQHAKVLKDDTIKVYHLTNISYSFYQIDKIESFKKINGETLKLAFKLNDSFVIADAYWSYADYYHNRQQYEKSYYYYNKALPYFKGIKKNYEAGRMLYSMAFARGRYRDYTGSEVLIFQAIELFTKSNNNRFLFNSYNLLGDLQNDIGKHDKALEYYEKSKKYLDKLTNKRNYTSTRFNNVGLTYHAKRNYKKAIKYFNQALDENKDDISHYARIIDNRAYSRLKLGDTSNVKKDLNISLKIRDSVNNKAGIVFVKIRLSKYYKHISNTINSIHYAKEANILAREIKNGVDYLESLKLLANLEPSKAKYYLEEYIRYNDSLIDTERKTLDKFTRIEFETDEVIEDNKILNQRLIWIFVISIGVILILSLLYIVRIQRAKNEKLFLETEQQKANEQVYLLTLKQQATLEEEKTRERNRISQELHDGILGRLFGTRVGMGFLDINADEETKKQHQSFLDELQEIEKEIRDVSHKLNTNFEDADVNFTTIINQLLESKSQVGDFKFHLNIDQNISWRSTDEIIKVNVYRIIQEALQNTTKHAQADNVTLDFFTDKNSLTIKLKDDGIGFSTSRSKKGIGLKNIRSRVEKMNGIINIVSASGKGTEIDIKIPIES